MSDAALLELPTPALAPAVAGEAFIVEPLESPLPGSLGTLPSGLTHWRFSVEQYHRMLTAGILTSNDQVELIEGWLIAKMAKNPPHSLSTALVREALSRLLPPGWCFHSQDPITTTDSEPEPDASVIRGSLRDYHDRHPGPADSALVIEVADSSLAFDRKVKKRLYARAAVPIYWIVNLRQRQVEVYTTPVSPAADPPSYRGRRVHRAGQVVPLVLDGQEVATVAVADLLP